MKKFGTRLISAVLAGCMMTSVLPVSAFALEGSTEFERTVSAQENSDAPAETSGAGYLLPTDRARPSTRSSLKSMAAARFIP